MTKAPKSGTQDSKSATAAATEPETSDPKRPAPGSKAEAKSVPAATPASLPEIVTEPVPAKAEATTPAPGKAAPSADEKPAETLTSPFAKVEDTKPPAPILSPKPEPASASKPDVKAEGKPEPKPEPKPLPKSAAAPTPPSEERGSSFWPALLGGVVAAGLGAVAVIWLFPNGIRPMPGDGGALEQALTEQRARIATLESEIAELRSAPAVPDGTAALSDELNARIAALEAGQGGAGVDELRAQIAALTQRIDGSGDFAAAEARIRDAQEQAAALARQAQARAALSHLQAALETGSPLDPARADLEAAGVTVPSSLSGSVPSLSTLSAAFPAAAREGLQASLRATRTEGSFGDRALAYLQSATGARSLNPQEGSDPDAVLSRAEAAVGAGNLADAVAEIETLPPEGQEAMSAWTADARLRLAAEEAVAGIATGLN